MNIKIVLIIILNCFLIINCQKKVVDFSKSKLWVEIKKETNDTSEVDTTNIKYNNNSIMILGKNAQTISIFNTSSKETLLLGTKKSEQHIIQYKDPSQNNTDDQKPQTSPYQIKEYPFKLIRDFSADNKNGIYVIELTKENKKLYLHILRFSKNGELLYKIGKNGRIKDKQSKDENNKNRTIQGFRANKAIQHFYCDTNGYLYLIMKNHTNTKYPSTEIDLYVFDAEGNLFTKKEYIEKLLPEIKGHSIFIEDIKVSPKSKEIITLSAYYNKKNTANKIAPISKVIYNIPLNNNNPTPIYTLKEENKLNQSIFGITNLNNIFLFANTPYYDSNSFTYTYLFEILSMKGKEKKLKTLRISKESNEKTKYIVLGDKEEIVYFVVYTNRIVCYFYT